MFGHKNMPILYLKAINRIKDFLFSEKSREFFIFLFFFFVAAGFWLLQTLNNDYEKEFSIPVRLRGVPDNVVITSEPATELRIRVKDKGTVLFNYIVGKSFYPVTLDFKDYASDNSILRITASQYEKKISGQLKTSTSLLSINPDTLEYIYSTGDSKRIPVKLGGELSAGKQYYIPDTIFEPDSVTVYAPKNVLDTITAAYTKHVVITGISDTLVRHIPLSVSKGIKFVPSSTLMTVPVDIYTEKTVEVPLHGVNFPPDKALIAFPSKIQVTFQIGAGHFRMVNAEDFHIDVHYEELLNLGNNKYTVRLDDVPEGIRNVRFNPEQIDFIIEEVQTDNGD